MRKQARKPVRERTLKLNRSSIILSKVVSETKKKEIFSQKRKKTRARELFRLIFGTSRCPERGDLVLCSRSNLFLGDVFSHSYKRFQEIVGNGPTWVNLFSWEKNNSSLPFPLVLSDALREQERKNVFLRGQNLVEEFEPLKKDAFLFERISFCRNKGLVVVLLDPAKAKYISITKCSNDDNLEGWKNLSFPSLKD